MRAQSGVTLSVRQLQAWDRKGIVVPEERDALRRRRIYGFRSVRRLCIIAVLMQAKFPSNRLGAALRNIESASAKVRAEWDELRVVTNGRSVYVVNGGRGIEVMTGQVVSTVLLGALDEGARKACRDVPVWRRAA
ncbi:MAG TPA: MerR family transcriptional regulator [Polyangiaceae bacterium]|nr:MerR family transcriptional regulator [Polyangiaceae bacterium]